MTIPTGSHDPDTLVGVAWGVTASPDDRGWAHALVTDLGGDPHDVDEGRRALYHAGLTLGSNAAAAAVAAARQLLLAARIERPEAFLAPLVEASVANVLARGAPALTGPVVRGDLGTLARHLEAVDADLPSVADAYRHLATAVLALARPSLPPDTACGDRGVARRAAGRARSRATRHPANNRQRPVARSRGATGVSIRRETTIAGLRAAVAAARANGARIGLVPTMGALHGAPRAGAARVGARRRGGRERVRQPHPVRPGRRPRRLPTRPRRRRRVLAALGEAAPALVFARRSKRCTRRRRSRVCTSAT
jgi:hypothetical protein